MPRKAIAQPYHVTDDGGISLDFHSGQWNIWDCTKRFVFATAGTQGGKTSFGPHWLRREIYHQDIGRMAGDYLAVTATYDLFKLKMLPAIRELFEHTTGDGRYWAGDKIIELRDPEKGFWAKRSDDNMWGRIILRSAESYGGLESSTANAAWLDECGMESFTAETWRAVRRRLSLSRGNVLGTTTLYVLYNWLRQLYDEWINGREDIEFINFASVINPSFPQAEYDQALQEMPEHVVNMQYRGLYDKPPGMIYGAFNSELCSIAPFAIPKNWPAYGGMDYGGTNTVCLLIRKNPDTGDYYLTKEYHEGGRTSQRHAKDLSAWNCSLWFGGAKSEAQWRNEFRAAGLPVREPKVSDVWVGINRVYGVMKKNKLFVFDTCQGTLAQIGSYGRKMNKATSEPIEDIIANKQDYHYLDALRYVLASLEKSVEPAGVIINDIDMNVYKSKRKASIWE